MKTNSLQWSENLYATAAIAAFATALCSWSLRHWLAVEQSKKDLINSEEERKVRAEQRIIEDREEARLEKAEAKAEKLATKRRKARGLLRNLWEDIFGTKE